MLLNRCKIYCTLSEIIFYVQVHFELKINYKNA